MSFLASPAFLRTVLLVDAATGFLSAALLLAAGGTLARATGLPATLLSAAGLSLLPIAAFMAFVGMRRPIPVAGVALIIAGNSAWAVASLWLIVAGPWPLTAFGLSAVLAQAIAVAVLAALEAAGLSRQPRPV